MVFFKYLRVCTLKYNTLGKCKSLFCCFIVPAIKCSVVYIYFRVKAFIQYGWADSIVDPDNVSVTNDESYGAPKTDNWMDIKEFYKSPDDVPRFTNAQIVTYFVTRQVCDSRLYGNFKAINNEPFSLWPPSTSGSIKH